MININIIWMSQGIIIIIITYIYILCVLNCFTT